MQKGMFPLTLFLVLCISSILAHCQYYEEVAYPAQLKEKVTHLRFYLNDILSGENPTAVRVAHPDKIIGDNSKPTPFGTVYAIDDPLTDGPGKDSKVIGNAQGLYLSSGKDVLSIVLYADFGFTTGKYNGSSISVFSRNPVADGDREVAVVGGRGKFRLARGFAKLKTKYLNVTNGDAVIEYKVTVYHY